MCRVESDKMHYKLQQIASQRIKFTIVLIYGDVQRL